MSNKVIWLGSEKVKCDMCEKEFYATVIYNNPDIKQTYICSEDCARKAYEQSYKQ